ncbi:MAG: winged helix-turn-helix domain-containing protein [archaeon]
MEGRKRGKQRKKRFHMIAKLLNITKTALKTQIMYKANLGLAQLNEYLIFLK